MRLATLPRITAEYMLVELDLGHKRQSTVPLTIREQELMLKVEVDIVNIPSTISPITNVTMLYCCLFSSIITSCRGKGS